MLIALAFVAALNCGASATQIDLDACAAHEDRLASAREHAAYQRAWLREGSRDRRALLAQSERSWRVYRHAMCGYVSMSAAGGSMQPMLYSECRALEESTRARVLDLLATGGASQKPETADRREESTIYGKLELLQVSYMRQLLERSEDAWRSYARVACRGASPPCNAVVTQGRIAALKASWLADPFW